MKVSPRSLPRSFQTLSPAMRGIQTVYKDPKLPLGVRIEAAVKAGDSSARCQPRPIRVIRGVEDLTDAELLAIAGTSEEDLSGMPH
jgi:hypothetical protein